MGVFLEIIGFIDVFYVKFWVKVIVGNKFIDFLVDIRVVYFVLNFKLDKVFLEIMIDMGVFGVFFEIIGMLNGKNLFEV